MIKVAYIHGFNSGAYPESNKIQELARNFEIVHVQYDSFADFDTIKPDLINQCKDCDLIIGTSLGAYWACVVGNYLALPVVAINPAYDPNKQLVNHVDIELTNYVTNEQKVLTQLVVDSYQHDIFEIIKKSFFKPLVAYDKGDEVISGLDVFDNHQLVYNTVSFKGGSHRFDHMKELMPYIVKYSNITSIAYVMS